MRLVNAKTTALAAEACAKALAHYGTCAQPDESTEPDTSDDLEADSQHEEVSSLAHKRIVANEAEKAAAGAARANGWLK
ncbi:hypothetical protein OG203_38685 [Nocardia sp. NBC_01499]|uniref:hypothetical protein n=1 Tax=Nocardia sp. NBC_01499 TaxID=2903597 RepID=UPI003867A375